MAEDQEERTEEATQAKRDEFRKQGQVAHSRELAGALFLLIAAGAIYSLGQYFFVQIVDLFDKTYGSGMTSLVRSGNYTEVLAFGGEKLIKILGPIFGVAVLVGISSSVLQTGFLQVEDALEPKWEKINPISGFGRIFSMRSAVEGLKALLKLIIITAIVYFLLKKEAAEIPYLLSNSVETILSFLGKVTVKLLSGIGLSMLAFSLADYFYQRWDLEKQMRMTKQEVKEEHKTREGDPLIKSRIRKMQREVAQRRMMQKVPEATVIVTNPTHIAVALKYDANLPAPQLIAKGADLIADKIKEIAREHNIPVIENKPLARTIYKTMKLGSVVPRELFVAVAEVISYVYRLKKKKVKK